MDGDLGIVAGHTKLQATMKTLEPSKHHRARLGEVSGEGDKEGEIKPVK